MTVHHPIPPVETHRPYRVTQRDFVLLSEHGAFREFAKVELIDGVIVTVNAQYSRHSRTQTLLLRVLADTCERMDGGLGAWLDASVSVDDHNMPQPDIVVSTTLPENGPVPLDIVKLVVEVADSSLSGDLGVKARLYARAGIAEYWIADVNAQIVHQLWAPGADGYAQRREVGFGGRLHAATIPELVLDLPGPA